MKSIKKIKTVDILYKIDVFHLFLYILIFLLFWFFFLMFFNFFFVKTSIVDYRGLSWTFVGGPKWVSWTIVEFRGVSWKHCFCSLGVEAGREMFFLFWHLFFDVLVFLDLFLLNFNVFLIFYIKTYDFHWFAYISWLPSECLTERMWFATSAFAVFQWLCLWTRARVSRKMRSNLQFGANFCKVRKFLSRKKHSPGST